MRGSYKHKIMVISDGMFSGTGFSEEMRNVFYRLAQTGEFNIIWFGLGQQCFPVDIPDTVFPDLPQKGSKIKLIGNRGDPYQFGAGMFGKHYIKYNPESVFFMGDPRNIAGYVSEPYNWKQKFHMPLIMLVTLDGTPVHPTWIEYLKHVNVLVTMSRWAQIEYAKAGLSPNVIHHGLNWNLWSNNPQLKKKLRKKYKIPEDCVLLINWDVYQHRKRPDALLRSFKKMKPETKNVKLLLYGDWDMDNNLGYNMEALIKQYDVPRENIISPLQLTGQPKYWEAPETQEELMEIARLGDIFVSCSSGEGAGKCSMEALSLGMPVVITDYSACSEYCEKGSILVPITGTYRGHDRMRSVEAGLVDEDKFAEALVRLYDNPKEREELGLQAREWSRNFDYDTVIIPQWLNLFRNFSPENILSKELLQL